MSSKVPLSCFELPEGRPAKNLKAKLLILQGGAS